MQNDVSSADKFDINAINWHELNHAYGDASDIPEILEQLKSYPSCEDYQSEPFFTLWSSLCHQGDVYSASYASVPFIASIIEAAPEKVNYNYFLLPVSIEIARLKGNGPEISADIKDSYLLALEKMAKLTTMFQSPDELMSRVLTAVTAIHSGNASLADAILELTPDVVEDFQEWIQER